MRPAMHRCTIAFRPVHRSLASNRQVEKVSSVNVPRQYRGYRLLLIYPELKILQSRIIHEIDETVTNRHSISTQT